jgi:hypothetical protein
MKRKIQTLSPSPADCKKLSIYSQTPLPKERELAETPPQADGVLKKLNLKKEQKRRRGN